MCQTENTMTPSPPSTFFCAECGRPAAAGEIVRFGDRLICAFCKDSYAQKLREGVAPARAMIYAGFWIRFLAYIIDFIILAGAGSLVNVAFGRSLIATIPMTPGTVPSPEALGRLFATLGLI